MMKATSAKEGRERSKTKSQKGSGFDKTPSSRRSSTDSKPVVESRSKSHTERVNVPPLNSRPSLGSPTVMDGRTHSASRLGHRPSSRADGERNQPANSRNLSRRNSTSQAVPTAMPPGRRGPPTRSASVSSNYSTASTYDSKMGDIEQGGRPMEVIELKRRLQEAINDREAVKFELMNKKQEIQSLTQRVSELKRQLSDMHAAKQRQEGLSSDMSCYSSDNGSNGKKEPEYLKCQLEEKKKEIQTLSRLVTELRRELSEVNTTKGALNDACVSGMMDAFALNAKVADLEDQKEELDQQNSHLKHEAAEYDRERRGLLDLLDDVKSRAKECEQRLEMEIARNSELEGGRSAANAQLGMELKWARQELAEKTLRIKKMARTNTKLACRLLAVEEDEVEANSLAQKLQDLNLQLEGDNQELAKRILALESHIDQWANERYASGNEMRTQQAARLEEDRAMVLNTILDLDEEIGRKKREVADGICNESELHELFEEKEKLQMVVDGLTEEIEDLKAEDKRLEEAELKRRDEYVQRLETELHGSKAHIDDLSKMLKGARESETESMSSHVKASEEISKLEADKAQLKDELLDLQSKLKQSQDETHNQVHVVREEMEREVQDVREEREKFGKMVQSLEKQLEDYQRSAQETDNIVRKLRQDIREYDQEKETLAYQVNVLEWQLVGLYSEKEDAVRTLADRELDIMRLTQELEDKEDDLANIRHDITEENEAQIEACELRFEKEQLEETLDEKLRYIKTLEYELEQLKKDKTIVDVQVKDTKKPQRPWFTVKVKL